MAHEPRNSPATSLFHGMKTWTTKGQRSERPRPNHCQLTKQDVDGALCLVMLSRDGDAAVFDEIHQYFSSFHATNSESYSYKCNECNKTFASYQALGGHKTSHKRPNEHHEKPANKAHECSVCHKSFSDGRALGGHMRRHFEGTIGGHTISHKNNGHECQNSLDLDPALPELSPSFFVSADNSEVSSPSSVKKEQQPTSFKSLKLEH